MTVLWISTLIAAFVLVGAAILACKIPRCGLRRMHAPTWTVVGSHFGVHGLSFGCADDVYGVYLWIRGLPSKGGCRKQSPLRSRVPVGRSPGEARMRSAERMTSAFDSDDLESPDCVYAHS